MFEAEKFIKYCSQTLESYLGHISNDIINKIRTKKNLDENSSDSDIKKFIGLIETNISVLSGKHRAVEICDIIRANVSEFGHTTKISDVNKEEVAKTNIDREDVNKEEVAKTNIDREDVNKEEVAKAIIDREDVNKEEVAKAIIDREDVNKEEVAKAIIDREDVNKEEVAKAIIDKKDITKRDTTRTVEEIREMWKITDEYLENKILVLLETGFTIDNILKKLHIEEEDLADRIIDLDTKEFVILRDKNWILTEKGKDELNLIRKKIKSDYLRGNINKEEFFKKLECIKKQTINKDDTEEKAEDPEKVPEEKAEDPEKVPEEKAEEPEKVPEEKAEEPENVPEDDKEIICDKCRTKNKVADIFCTKCGEYMKKL